MAGRVQPGSPEPLGVTATPDGINVAVFSRHGARIEFCLFDGDGRREIERIALPERTGDVHHGHIAGVRAGARYGLRAHGPFDPLQGQRFNPAKLLVDPYALALDRPFALHRSMFGYRLDDPAADLSLDDTDSAPFMPKAIIVAPGPAPAREPPRIPWSETILYELHVRGFTKRLGGVPEPLRGTLAGLAHPAALDHLVRLGVTSVELMPLAAWIDERHLGPLGLTNYWGYNPIGFMAPDPRLAPGGWREVRAAVEALHGAGIEVILDVVLNHSGESDELGPTLSLRGLDNAVYYRLLPGDGRHYVNDTGCGHCLALDREPVVRLAMDILRTWAIQAGIDGFRFDLGTALGRRDTGFDANAPLLAAIGADPVLKDLKLIAEPWDIGPGGYRLGGFPPQWGEWNDRYRDGVRRFWRGDGGFVGELATRLAGSADVFQGKLGPSRGIAFLIAHDGFTLADLVAYERKHNEANGEHNRDGHDPNFSWNNGVEGASADPGVTAARRRDQKNLLATLLISRGTPMLAMGSELGHSQQGNNNAYAQDNAIGWIDWTAADADLLAFTQRLIAIRREHPALRQDMFLSGRPFDDSGLLDVDWRGADGQALTPETWGTTATLVMTLCAPRPDAAAPDRVAAIIHRGAEATSVVLPEPRDGYEWVPLIDSGAEPGAAVPPPDETHRIRVAPRCVVILAESVATQPQASRRALDPRFLDRLAAAAGIAAEWWDIGGTRHVVGSDTKRVLLRGMGLDADSNTQARESLARLSGWTGRAAIPPALVRRAGEPIEIRLPHDAAGEPVWLQLVREDGSTERFRIDASTARRAAFTTIDGRACEAWLAMLPPQPLGRHRIVRGDDPDRACELTVAPHQCYVHPGLGGDRGRRSGVAAHLYTVRRDADQGIGDFTTLGQLAERAAATGSATIGLNPLHALFPDDRERASPYHPSDRRFLDPIYVDVAALDDLPGAAARQALLAIHAAEIGALSRAPLVDYSGVWKLKSAVLESSFAAFDAALRSAPDGAPAREFGAFVARGEATLHRFACFQSIAETRPKEPWFVWPEPLPDATSRAVEDFAASHAARMRFHMFAQWLCERQFAAAADRAAAAGLTLGFYRDLAVGAAPDGAEAWSQPADFVRGVAVGSPPDPFSAEGQIWHLPPLNPLMLPRANYRPFVTAIAANMRHAGALRIDHAMGLARLFYVPNGARPGEGTYVAYPLDDLLGQLALESTRHQCLVVGEDLGTVPEGFRERLAQAEVLSYRVLWLERDGAAIKPPAAYPAKAVACVSTHDLPTLAGWWAGTDIDERRALGLIGDAETVGERRARDADKHGLAAALAQAGLIDAMPDSSAPLPPAFAAGVHAYLARSPTALVLAQADDLAGETSAVNLPGTDRERPNWRRKLAPDVAALFAGDGAQAMLRALRDTRETPA